MRGLVSFIVLSTCPILGWTAPVDGALERSVLGSTVLPSEDAFYQPPAGFESARPGDILAHRKVPAPIAAFGTLTANLENSYQLLYRTTDTFGNASATVTTILVPHKADFGKLLSYQVAEDAASINCAPSYALQLRSDTGGFVGTIVTQAEILLIAGGLEQGWVVAVPDFQGPHGAYVANTYAGQAVLDGIRAAISSSSITGIQPDSTITMWGYSGGSLASGRAAELQPQYAPELKIAGVAIGGTVPNITSTLLEANKSPFSGLIPAVIVGLSHEYPELAALVSQELIPAKEAAFRKTESQCFGADIVQFLFQDILSYFKDPDVLYTNPISVKALDDNGMGKAVPTIPILLYKSVNDEVSPVADTDALVEYYCQNGGLVEYKRDVASEHGALAILGAPEALIWLKARMRSEPMASACSISTALTTLADPGSLSALSQVLIDDLLDPIFKPIGPVVFG